MKDFVTSYYTKLIKFFPTQRELNLIELVLLKYGHTLAKFTNFSIT